MPRRSIGELGEIIFRLTRSIEEASSVKGVKGPTLNDEISHNFAEIKPQEIAELIEAARELEVLAQGPRQTLGLMGLSVYLSRYTSLTVMSTHEFTTDT